MDDHIIVRYLGFDAVTGEARFEVIERHQNVGFYYIWILYGPNSGPPPGPPSLSSFTYDGAHPSRFGEMSHISVRTESGKDTVRGIKVKRVRD